MCWSMRCASHFSASQACLILQQKLALKPLIIPSHLTDSQQSMEPITTLSLTSAVLTVTARTVNTAQTLNNFKTEWQDLPTDIDLLLSGLRVLRSTLFRLEDVLHTTEEHLRSCIVYPQLLVYEITHVGTILEKLEFHVNHSINEVERIHAQAGGPVEFQVLWGRGVINNFLSDLRWSRKSLETNIAVLDT